LTEYTKNGTTRYKGSYLNG
jgi:antitoxin component YwqK of YwqJK toxin-antitoxin module